MCSKMWNLFEVVSFKIFSNNFPSSKCKSSLETTTVNICTLSRDKFFSNADCWKIFTSLMISIKDSNFSINTSQWSSKNNNTLVIHPSFSLFHSLSRALSPSSAVFWEKSKNSFSLPRVVSAFGFFREKLGIQHSLLILRDNLPPVSLSARNPTLCALRTQLGRLNYGPQKDASPLTLAEERNKVATLFHSQLHLLCLWVKSEIVLWTLGLHFCFDCFKPTK